MEREIIVAKTAGFCFGVKRAVDMVYEQSGLSGDGPIYTYGPIIHNEEVVNSLSKRGVNAISEEESLDIREGTVVLRSHGVGRDVVSRLEENGVNIVDATCPFVKKIHRTVMEQSQAGRTIVIVGDPSHPEVQGIMGWVEGKACVVQTPEEARALCLPEGTRVCVVSQTTFNYHKFQLIVEIISKMSYDNVVVNTICNATHERQAEAKELAGRVELMLVIGGKNSSNTQKLFEICKEECSCTYYIQTFRDLNKEWLADKHSVGITAGASTPNNIIQEVLKECRS